MLAQGSSPHPYLLVVISLRHAQAGDLPSVLSLWAGAEAEPTVTDDEAALTQLLRFAPDALLLAVEGDRLLGTLITAWDGWRGSFYRLVVARDRRREGIARRLVEAGEDHLARLGARRLAVFTVASDPRATPFWQAVGYEAQEDRQRLIKNLP